MKQKILIIGAGGLGREVAAMIRYTELNREYEVAGFIDDGLKKGSTVNQWEVVSGIEEFLIRENDPVSMVLAIGDPTIREKIYGKLAKRPFINFPNIISPTVKMHNKSYIHLGMGNIICDGNILTTNIEIGNFNLINLSCTIGHDVKIGNFCSIMPGVNISGGIQMQDKVYVGTGASLIKSTLLGEGAVIGAGAVVNTNVEPHTTYTGIPARRVQ